MTSPITSIGSVAGTPSTVELARRLRELQQGGGASGSTSIQADDPRRYTIDVGAGDDPSFGDTLRRVLNETSAAQDRSAEAIERFVRGEPVELHQVMAAAEEASIALEMLVELRNKLTDAYRTLVTMQS